MVMVRVKRSRVVPLPAMALGAAGLAPTIVAIIVRLSGGEAPEDSLVRFVSHMMLMSNALILSFLGGIWWGLGIAKVEPERAAPFLALSIVPTVLALLIVGLDGWMPRPAFILLGLALIATLLVDRRLHALELVPKWWLRLRVPLSVALGVLTILYGLFA